MSRNPFGWSYPAGAENDPNAPYNQVDLPDTCPWCGGDNSKPEPGADEPFCSLECQDKYEAREEDLDERRRRWR